MLTMRGNLKGLRGRSWAAWPPLAWGESFTGSRGQLTRSFLSGPTLWTKRPARKEDGWTDQGSLGGQWLPSTLSLPTSWAPLWWVKGGRVSPERQYQAGKRLSLWRAGPAIQNLNTRNPCSRANRGPAVLLPCLVFVSPPLWALQDAFRC